MIERLLVVLRKTFCAAQREGKLSLLMVGWLVALLMCSALFAPDKAPAQADQEPVPIPNEQESDRPLPEAREDSDDQDDQDDQEDLESATAHHVYAIIADAWLAEDHKKLAEVVAEDGVVIAIAPDRKRDSRYSPDQAFYFFKNLFQFAHTDSFEFRRLQDEEEGGVIHAVADWKYRRTGSEALVGERFIFTLTSSTSGWGLIEIRAIR